MSELRERDAMICRSCGQEERASEGYPCKDCGTFICIMCVFKGVVRCERCHAIAARASTSAAGAIRPVASGTAQAPPDMDWPEH
jgi:hypothetical protein